METKHQMILSAIKHTGKSVISDQGSKRVNVKLLSYNDNTTIYEANEQAYGITFEEKDNNLVVTLTQGGHVISTMDYNEFINKLIK